MESPSFRSSRLASNPYPSRAFYLACADGRKALAKDATESAVGWPRRIPSAAGRRSAEYRPGAGDQGRAASADRGLSAT